jgi:long-chain acyl-CoA synthetase
MPKRAPNRIAVKFKSKSKWIQWNWSQYYEAICSLGIGLLDHEVFPGQRIGIVSQSRLEWAITDAAIMALGAVSVPIYPTLTAKEIDFIIQDSKIEILILEDRFLLNKLKTHNPSVFDNLKLVILFEKAQHREDSLYSWHAILANGRQLMKYRQEVFEARLRDTRSNDIATIVYTSGTSGNPKGVMLTHTQIMSELGDTFPLLGVSPDDISLSFLPFSHILGRIELWGHWFVGFQLSFAESQERLRHNLLEINPTILIVVPRVLEKIYALAFAQIESNIMTNEIFKYAIKLQGYFKKLPDQNLYKKTWEIASDILLSQIKGLFGNRLRFAVCGGAKLNPEINEFFNICGVLILEGYGLSETTGAITVNRPFEFEIGTVGKPIGDVKIKLDVDGEILVKSKKVMSGYINSPKEEFITQDGWLRTGDIGEWSSLGNLKIVDRKKELIKTSSGKFISPIKLSQLLLKHKWISQVYISGNERKYAAALITLNKWQVLSDLKKTEISDREWEELTQSPTIQDEIKKHITQINSELSSFETIKRFSLLTKEFSVAEGEMTVSLKLRPRVIEAKYKSIIDHLYMA